MVKKKYQAVFFDFDGVILDSVNVKTKAFAKMFKSYGTEIEKKVVEYHLENGGVSRFEKFRYYYKNFFNKTITEADVQKLSAEFSDIVIQDVIDSAYAPGVGTPEPFGLKPELVRDIIRHYSPRMIGFDVVELSPRSGFEAADFLAAKLIYRLLGYIFSNKK